MTLLALSLGFAMLPAQADAYQLPIGRAGTSLVLSGRITDLGRLRSASPDDIAVAARDMRFVYLGEQHATAAHQQMQAEIIDALVRDGRVVTIGLEMLQRSTQPVLNELKSGMLRESDFEQKVDWKNQWGFDFAYYRPVFDAARRHGSTILGLNVPRDWVRNVGRGGFAALTPEQASQLPENMNLGNKAHRSVFDALMGGHPGMPAQAMDNVYAAQVLWDEGMADTLAKYVMNKRLSSKAVFVVIAGAGHLMYGQGINWRAEQRGLGQGITVVMLKSTPAVRVSNGLANFVYVSPE